MDKTSFVPGATVVATGERVLCEVVECHNYAKFNIFFAGRSGSGLLVATRCARYTLEAVDRITSGKYDPYAQ